MDIKADLINDLEAMIDGIPFGASSWFDFVSRLASDFPGSFAAIHNANFSLSQLNSFYPYNIGDDFVRSYRDHYAALNPWEGYWARVPAGTVAASERVAPAAMFQNSEFYNDWLKPQNNVAAGSGLKIAGDDGETIRLLMHYPLDKAASYDDNAVRVMERLRGSLGRTMQMLRSMRESTEAEIGRAALVARGDRAAFVVDAGCHVEDANDRAEALFRAGQAVAVRHGRVVLRQPSAHEQFSEAVWRLCRGEPVALNSLPLENEVGRWLVSIAAIGSGAAYEISGLLAFRRRVFVTITPLSAERLSFPERATTRRLFQLSPAEHDLCARLMQGYTLNEIADATGISRETARSRLKSIFIKTGVTRQAELILLFSKLVL